jgi:hypothetical protein
MSTETMKSSFPSARSRRLLLGVDRAGFAGVRDERAHLAFAGRLDLLRETCDRQLAERLGKTADAALPAADLDAAAEPGFPLVLRAPAAAFVNIAPPGRSRFPVSTLSTSTSQLAVVPNSCVQVPIRA